jgi:hypothetical protein
MTTLTVSQWTAALRSGKYSQGVRRLQNSGGEFCCFGVACDVADPDAWLHRGTQYSVWLGRGAEATHYAPPSLLDELGLSESDAVLLTLLNDGSAPTLSQKERCREVGVSIGDRVDSVVHLSFAEIADAIERMLPGAD